MEGVHGAQHYQMVEDEERRDIHEGDAAVKRSACAQGQSQAAECGVLQKGKKMHQDMETPSPLLCQNVGQ